MNGLKKTAVLALLAAAAMPALAASPPDSVAPPKAINLGSTSFYDGFGRTDEGFTWLQYARFEDLTRITDYQGNNNPLFKQPTIHVYVTQTQISYISPWHPFGGDGVGIAALLPIDAFTTHFADKSPVKLTDSPIGFGDLNIGPVYQSKYYLDQGRPVFAWRTQLSVIAPIGTHNEHDNINQGSGFWSFNPYVAATWVPTPRLEFSTRINYLYNFQTSTFSNPPPIPHLIYRNGQAGQLVFGNFDASYGVLENVFLGINGYALAQLTPDRTNGQDVSHSRETEVSIGPGARYVVDASTAVNFNLYLPVVSHNASSGTQVNMQFVHRF